MMDTRINIYYSRWDALKLFAGGLVFGILGLFIIMDSDADLFIKIIGGYGCLLMGLATAVIFIVALLHRPYLMVFHDRLESNTLFRHGRTIVMFRDVERFRITEVFGQKYLSVDFKTAPLVHTFDASTGMLQKMMVTNHRITGSVYNFKASGLTMKPQALADMLNARLV